MMNKTVCFIGNQSDKTIFSIDVFYTSFSSLDLKLEFLETVLLFCENRILHLTNHVLFDAVQ
jgi:hypothetical protein